ncbi:E3 ubiquitin-protein ligase TRIM71-like [Anneissia japonica]|uniref:E3 ubiquitin-protein ligase TRIM71-like n=1 Tax=Anneissia japonica TaxID=1529436 RepID=UPI0014258221|nr:E3 ubiquitin-protein ligase TRIM71-like [Anneissia japonica]
MAASVDFLYKNDFYVISDDAEWEKTTIIELQKRRPGIRCICRDEWIPGKYRLENLTEPVNTCKKVVVGFAPSSTGSPNFLAQTVVQEMLDSNNINEGKLIPVRISRNAMIPKCLRVLTPANSWEHNVYEKLLRALDGENIKLKVCNDVDDACSSVHHRLQKLFEIDNEEGYNMWKKINDLLSKKETDLELQYARDGSIIFYLSVYNPNALTTLWKIHLSGHLIKELANILIPEDLQEEFFKKWATKIDETEYHSVLHKLNDKESQVATGIVHHGFQHSPEISKMVASKALQFLDKKDLTCAICQQRFIEPKTLNCLHSYCFHCLESLIKVHGNLRCPQCNQHHELKNEDLNKLTSNEMINYLLKYVGKAELEKPSTCSSCDNPPKYHCNECSLYLCKECSKHHKIIPALKGHPLYTLDENEKGGKDEHNKCPTHSNNVLEFYCSTCNKSACGDCKYVLRCYQNKHNVIPMKNAVDEFNHNATEVMNIAQGIKNKLKGTLDSITLDRSDFEYHLKLCRVAIEEKEKTVIMKVKEKSKELISDLEKIHKEKKDDIDYQVEAIDSKMTKVNNVMASITKMINKPDKKDALGSNRTTINNVRDEVLSTNFDKLFYKRNITPNFIPSTHFDEFTKTEGIGKIKTVDGIYMVAKNDEAMTVTKGQQIVVTVSSLNESGACKLSATLKNISHEESATEVEYQGNGEYKITGRCKLEGDWQMKISAGDVQIKGSPVNIKVESLGLVHTIKNIQNCKEHTKDGKVTDVVLDTDGCILVSSFSKDILKFNQSGLFVDRIEMPQEVMVNKMHLMDDGYMVYIDFIGKCVTMCDDKFQEIHSVGKGILKYPMGLTVNKKTRDLYVADSEAHCVYKFNVDDGRLLGKIGSEGSNVGQLNTPYDVTLTKEGHVIVVDFGNRRLQMFDADDKFMRILVGSGERDGKVKGPCGVIIDMDENIIVSSNDKLQLFNKNCIFIKRIDHKGDGLDTPVGITVISNRPRRVAVANHKANNVKMFNY